MYWHGVQPVRARLWGEAVLLQTFDSRVVEIQQEPTAFFCALVSRRGRGNESCRRSLQKRCQLFRRRTLLCFRRR